MVPAYGRLWRTGSALANHRAMSQRGLRLVGGEVPQMRVSPRGPGETKLALYHRAALLGNQVAAHAEEVELQKRGQAVADKEMQIQQARIAGEVFNIILQGMRR
jgi:hypothetical protein